MRKLFAIALLITAVSALAQNRTASCTCGVPGSVPTTWEIRHVDPTAQQAAVNAFNTWNLYVDVLRPQVGSAVNYDFGNGHNEILFFDFSTVPGLDASTVGFAPSLPQGAFGNFNQCPMPAGTSCGIFSEADVWLSNAIDWHVAKPNVDDSRDAAYYYSTAIHEIGHTMGLHHNFKNVSTMNYYQDYAGQFVSRADVLAARSQFPSRTKTVSDLATYAFRYNADQQNGSYGNGALTPASVSPSQVSAGGSVTIRNWTIENLGTSAVTSARLRFFLSTDTNITTSDVYIGGFKWEPLTTWSDDPDGFQFTIPAGTPAGQYYLGAIVGSGDNLDQDAITYNNSWYLPAKITVGGGAPSAVCTPSANRACLNNNRYGVELTFRTPDGAQKNATAIKYTENSALYWFSGPDNIELVVKVLDACGFANHYWVYGAAATDLQFTLTVTDSKSGKVKTYTHAAGTPATAITDQSTFDTCP
ncbi:MAG TPA: matrixin family metalloprotease [Thermoanaerobaculia bacterium]|nr:matrixin family metalloprotease [Thermoanaerobaculia bacterium]